MFEGSVKGGGVTNETDAFNSYLKFESRYDLKSSCLHRETFYSASSLRGDVAAFIISAEHARCTAGGGGAPILRENLFFPAADSISNNATLRLNVVNNNNSSSCNLDIVIGPSWKRILSSQKVNKPLNNADRLRTSCVMPVYRGELRQVTQ